MLNLFPYLTEHVIPSLELSSVVGRSGPCDNCCSWVSCGFKLYFVLDIPVHVLVIFTILFKNEMHYFFIRDLTKIKKYIFEALNLFCMKK